jgi:hypothetical protein
MGFCQVTVLKLLSVVSSGIIGFLDADQDNFSRGDEERYWFKTPHRSKRSKISYRLRFISRA